MASCICCLAISLFPSCSPLYVHSKFFFQVLTLSFFLVILPDIEFPRFFQRTYSISNHGRRRLVDCLPRLFLHRIWSGIPECCNTSYSGHYRSEIRPTTLRRGNSIPNSREAQLEKTSIGTGGNKKKMKFQKKNASSIRIHDEIETCI